MDLPIDPGGAHHIPEGQVKVFLEPGKMYVGEGSAEVSTILGSCVSVTMFCERIRIGAICHAVPEKGEKTAISFLTVYWSVPQN